MQNLSEILMPVFYTDDNRRQREIGQVTLIISKSSCRDCSCNIASSFVSFLVNNNWSYLLGTEARVELLGQRRRSISELYKIGI